MVATEQSLDRIFYALSDPSRRQMIRDLASGNCHVKELANSFSFSKAATSKHLAVLEEAGLIKKTRQGRDVLCSLNPHSLQSIETLDSFLSSVLAQSSGFIRYVCIHKAQ